VIENEFVDTGAGILNSPIMPLPPLLLGLFGTPARFFLNSVNTYDPATGNATLTQPAPISTNVYFESQLVQGDQETAQEMASGTIYVDGRAFGFTTQALLLLKVRATGDRLRKVETATCTPQPDPDPGPGDDQVNSVAENTALNFTNPDGLDIADGAEELVQNAFNRAVADWNRLVVVDGEMLEAAQAVDADFAGLEVTELRWVDAGLAGCGQDQDDFIPQGDADDIRMVGRRCIIVVNHTRLSTAGGAWNEDDLVVVMKHEICHGLGVGRWQFDPPIGGNVNAEDPDWLLDGTAYDLSLAAYQNVTNLSAAVGVPLENVGAAGTQGVHWERARRTVDGIDYRGLSDELMVGGASPGARRIISSVTLSYLEEIGYTVIGEPEGVPTLGRKGARYLDDEQYTCFDYQL
jgi:hypothetical protein